MSGQTARKIAVTFAAAALLGGAQPRTPSETGRTGQSRAGADVYRTAKEVYVYAFPLVLMDATRRAATGVATPQPNGRAPTNQFSHIDHLPTPDDKLVVRPNLDTLYSTAWLDLSKEPMVLRIPDMGDRYSLIPVLDAWTNVVASPGKRTTGTGARTILIAGPGFEDRTVRGVDQKVNVPTNVAWIIGRIQVDGEADVAKVRALQKQMTLTPLSAVLTTKEPGARSVEPPRKPAGEPTMRPQASASAVPLDDVLKMDGATFFGTFASLIEANPPAEADRAMIPKLEMLGLAPGKPFDAASMDADRRRVLDRAVTDGQKEIEEAVARLGTPVNGWRMPGKNTGAYGTDYRARAAVALGGLGANLTEDAIYPTAMADESGQPLLGSKGYVLHFDKADLPPVRAFWSLTLYDERGFLVPNEMKRYAVGHTTPLTPNADGSIDIYIQNQAPPGDRKANWLPAPKGAFSPTLRLYWPEEAALNGKWKPPPLRAAAAP